MENLVADTVKEIMKLLDIKSLYQMVQSSKMFYVCLSEQNLWKQKLSLDYKILRYPSLSALESYKWCKKVPSIVSNRVLKIFDAFWFPSDDTINLPFGNYLIKALRISGPNIDLIYREVSNCGLESFLLKCYSSRYPRDGNSSHKRRVEKFYKHLYDAINITFSEDAEKFLMAVNHIELLNKKKIV